MWTPFATHKPCVNCIARTWYLLYVSSGNMEITNGVRRRYRLMQDWLYLEKWHTFRYSFAADQQSHLQVSCRLCLPQCTTALVSEHEGISRRYPCLSDVKHRWSNKSACMHQQATIEEWNRPAILSAWQMAVKCYDFVRTVSSLFSKSVMRLTHIIRQWWYV